MLEKLEPLIEAAINLADNTAPLDSDCYYGRHYCHFCRAEAWRGEIEHLPECEWITFQVAASVVAKAKDEYVRVVLDHDLGDEILWNRRSA